MSMIGVYIIASQANRKVYVGASLDIKTRVSAHKNQLKKGKHFCKSLQQDWNIFGESNFEFKVLELSDARNYAFVERKYIKGFASLSENCLYNQRHVAKKIETVVTKKRSRRTGRYPPI